MDMTVLLGSCARKLGFCSQLLCFSLRVSDDIQECGEFGALKQFRVLDDRLRAITCYLDAFHGVSVHLGRILVSLRWFLGYLTLEAVVFWASRGASR